MRLMCLIAFATVGADSFAAPRGLSPEEIVRAVIKANADKDLAVMEELMSRHPDMELHTIEGRSYTGWASLSLDMEQEFRETEKIEIPIYRLSVEENGDTAWFSVELDYIRYLRKEEGLEKHVFPLRETGVLQRRDGEWAVVMWHEYYRNSSAQPIISLVEPVESSEQSRRVEPGTSDLSGVWRIEEQGKEYRAYLDSSGNGCYDHDGGMIRTVKREGGAWEGAWTQTGVKTGSERNGEFSVVFKETEKAVGDWWYLFVAPNYRFKPRERGGWYRLTRVPGAPVPACASSGP
ncbi:MAG: nuclear transport factor 2 family protein [Elusimicrobiota bacterium]